MWHPEIDGEASPGGYDLAWRHGWRLGPRASSSHTGAVRRMVYDGHSYAYVGTSPWTTAIPLKVAAAIGVHGRWEENLRLLATNGTPPAWLDLVGRWRAVNGTGLRMEAGSDRASVWWDNETAEGWLGVNMTGMANYTNVWLGCSDRRNGYLLVGSASFAGWTVQRLVDGVVVWSSVQGLTGWSDGEWWFGMSGRTLRVITPTDGTWAVWRLPTEPPGTRFGIEQASASPGLVLKELRWVPMTMQGVSGSIMAGNDTIGSGSWSTVYQQQPEGLDRGDVAVLVWGINDLVAQSLQKMAWGFEAVLSWLLAGARPSSESADYDRLWAPAGFPPDDGLEDWFADEPANWRHSGQWIHSCSTVGGTVSLPVDQTEAGRVFGLRFADEPAGGTVRVRCLDARGAILATPVPGLVISGGTGYSGYRAARTVRVVAVPGTRRISIEVTALTAGGLISFDGWHVEGTEEAPRIVWANIARLSNPPSPWNTITTAKVNEGNALLRATAAAFGSPRIVEADMDAAIGGNAAMFSDGLHPNAAGATAVAGVIAAALSTIPA